MCVLKHLLRSMMLNVRSILRIMQFKKQQNTRKNELDSQIKIKTVK